MTEKETEIDRVKEHHGRNNRDEKRKSKRKKWGEVLKRATQGFVYHPGPPAIPLPFGDDTVKCSVPSLGEQDNRS